MFQVKFILRDNREVSFTTDNREEFERLKAIQFKSPGQTLISSANGKTQMLLIHDKIQFIDFTETEGEAILPVPAPVPEKETQQ
jgi:hypothetical protein